ncbi:uncharacterized protein VTP21DRAFT_2482 [Calcarisporiella thermophila]|uniref:uncharacterized protein n=1 Tax=Calcarisporiella thermophila TaxID=911321 RepID=UPI0037430DDB
MTLSTQHLSSFQANFLSLPPCVLELVLQHPTLSPADRCELARTCRLLNNLTKRLHCIFPFSLPPSYVQSLAVPPQDSLAPLPLIQLRGDVNVAIGWEGLEYTVVFFNEKCITRVGRVTAEEGLMIETVFTPLTARVLMSCSRFKEVAATVQAPLPSLADFFSDSAGLSALLEKLGPMALERWSEFITQARLPEGCMRLARAKQDWMAGKEARVMVARGICDTVQRLRQREVYYASAGSAAVRWYVQHLTVFDEWDLRVRAKLAEEEHALQKQHAQIMEYVNGVFSEQWSARSPDFGALRQIILDGQSLNTGEVEFASYEVQLILERLMMESMQGTSANALQAAAKQLHGALESLRAEHGRCTYMRAMRLPPQQVDGIGRAPWTTQWSEPIQERMLDAVPHKHAFTRRMFGWLLGERLFMEFCGKYAERSWRAATQHILTEEEGDELLEMESELGDPEGILLEEDDVKMEWAKEDDDVDFSAEESGLDGFLPFSTSPSYPTSPAYFAPPASPDDAAAGPDTLREELAPKDEIPANFAELMFSEWFSLQLQRAESSAFFDWVASLSTFLGMARCLLVNECAWVEHFGADTGEGCSPLCFFCRNACGEAANRPQPEEAPQTERMQSALALEVVQRVEQGMVQLTRVARKGLVGEWRVWWKFACVEVLGMAESMADAKTVVERMEAILAN